VNKKERNIDFYKEIYVKFDVSGIKNFDYATLRMNISSAYPKPENLACSIYCMPDERKSDYNNKNQVISGALLAEIKVKKSGWIEWAVNSQQLKEFGRDTHMFLKIVLAVNLVNTKSEFGLFKRKCKA